MTDEEVLDMFLTPSGKFRSSILRKINSIDDSIIVYLYNRYTDNYIQPSKTKEFIIYIVKRIKYNIDVHPVCKICNKPLNLNGYLSQHIKYCSAKCAQHDQELREKIKQTKFDIYGDRNYVNTEKAKQTCLSKYGVEYTGQIPQKIEKSKQTWTEHWGTTSPAKLEKTKITLKEKYNVENIFQYKDIIERNKDIYNSKSSEQKEKIKEVRRNTLYNKYGVKYYSQTQEHFKKVIETNNKKYGVDYYNQLPEAKQHLSEIISSKEVQENRYNTLKAHNTFNTSKIEQQLIQYFDDNYIKYEYQYMSEFYPYKCDFYLIDFNLYLEIQGSWTHGGHPFDNTNQDDIEKLNLFSKKAETSQYFKNAINTWTVTDVNKRNIAKQNNLNYLEIFSCKFDECIKQLNNFLYKK